MDTKLNESPTISRMDALLFAVALEVSLLQLRIHEGSTELRLAGKKDESGKLQYEKLVREREMAKDVLRRTLVEVAEHGEWETLRQAVGVLEQITSIAICKRREHDQLKMTRRQTLNELFLKRDEWADKLRGADLKVAFLRDKKQDDLLNANTRLRYAELWLSARAEAQELKFQMQMTPAPIPRTEHEQRVHQEICKAIGLQIEERQKALDYWQTRYAEDIANINQRLAEKRQQLQIATLEREKLQEVYNEHAGEMRGWLLFKEQRALRLAREQRARTSATRIQAWWRGLMVRRALGPFKYLRNIKKSPAKTKKK